MDMQSAELIALDDSELDAVANASGCGRRGRRGRRGPLANIDLDLDLDINIAVISGNIVVSGGDLFLSIGQENN